jgi:hypothetical protein
LRRQVKALVDADWQLNACNYGSYSSDSKHDITRYQSVLVFAGQMHQLVVCEAGDVDAIAGICIGDEDVDHSNLPQNTKTTTVTG